MLSALTNLVDRLILWGILAAGSGHAAPGASGKVETAGLEGLSLWVAQLHNDRRAAYAFGVVAVLLIAGALLGVLSEAALSLIGCHSTPLERIE